MNGIDWFIVILIVLSSLLGLIRGFVREAISLVTWLLGLWLAWAFSYLVEPYLGGVLAQPMVKVWVARLIILVGVLLVGAVIGLILSQFVRHSPFGGTDRALGLFFGMLRAAVLIGIGVIVGELLRLDTETWWQQSKLLPYGEFFAEWIRHLVPSDTGSTGA